MKNLTSFRDAGSLIAGLLIGLSFVVMVFAMTIGDASGRQMVWIMIAPIALACGLVFQLVITRPRHRRTNDRELAASP